MSVIGIDASSTRLAAVILDGDQVHVEKVKLASDVTEACGQAYWWLIAVLRDYAEYKPRLVALEAPFFHRAHPSGSVPISQVNGALLAAMSGVQSISVQPSRWKKSVLGNGKADKAAIKAWVGLHHPKALDKFVTDGKHDQDLTDAFCIALHALHVISLRDRMTVRR